MRLINELIISNADLLTTGDPELPRRFNAARIHQQSENHTIAEKNILHGLHGLKLIGKTSFEYLLRLKELAYSLAAIDLGRMRLEAILRHRLSFSPSR